MKNILPVLSVFAYVFCMTTIASLPEVNLISTEVIETVMSFMYRYNPSLKYCAQAFINAVDEMREFRNNRDIKHMKLSRFELFNQIFQISSHFEDTIQDTNYGILLSQFADTLQTLTQNISDRDNLLYLSTCSVLTSLQYQIFYVISVNLDDLEKVVKKLRLTLS